MNQRTKDFFNHFLFDSISYDDILLEPRPSNKLPSKVSLESRLGPNVKLKIPFLSADMDTVTEDKMGIAIAKLGGIGFLWKHDDIKEQLKWVKSVKNHINGVVLKPISIQSNLTIHQVNSKLAEYQDNFSTLVVVDENNRFVGLTNRKQRQFSQSDSELISKHIQADENMIRNSDFKNVQTAYDYMRKKHLSKVVILDKDRKIKGLYCYKDLKNIIEKRTPQYNTDLEGHLVIGANVGASKDAIERAEALLEKGVDAILVGTSKGDSYGVIKIIKEIARLKFKYDFDLIGGNIASYEGAKAIYGAGADTVKVGIGPGSICTTRIVTGTGAAQISAIYNATKAKNNNPERYIIADGGIKQSGDIVKAFAVGADSVMMGSMLAGTTESPGELIYIGGEPFKSYRGMGSIGAMERSKGAAQRYSQQDRKLTPEGVEGVKPLIGSLEDITKHLIGGISSGMGQINASTIREILEVAHITRISPAGLKESHVHDVAITKQAPNYNK